MKNPHSLEKPAATLIAAATLLAGMGLPPAALAADGSASAPSSSASGNGADDKDQTNAGDTTTRTLMGAVLTADDKGTLTLPDGQSLPTFDKRPDNASVQGSDGTTIPLTLADAAEEHPNLGVTTGTGILTAEAKDGHPAVHVPATDHGHGDHAERRHPVHPEGRRMGGILRAHAHPEGRQRAASEEHRPVRRVQTRDHLGRTHIA